MQQHINNPQASEYSSQSMAIRLAELNNQNWSRSKSTSLANLRAPSRMCLTFRLEPIIDMCSLENQLDTFDTMRGAQ